MPAENAEAQAATQKLSGSLQLQDSPHTLVMLSKTVDSTGFSVLTLTLEVEVETTERPQRKAQQPNQSLARCESWRAREGSGNAHLARHFCRRG